MRRRVSFRTGLLWVMGVGLLGFVCAAGLALLDIQVSPVVTAALGMSSIWAPTALCWTAFYRVRLRRPEVLLAGALVARWGGEEFFVALPGADATTGLTIADDLRLRCAQDTIDVECWTIGCTLSGGVAAYPSSGTTMDELFHAADLAMYQAKNAGRNVVRQALDRALFTGAHHAVGRAVSLHPDQAQ